MKTFFRSAVLAVLIALTGLAAVALPFALMLMGGSAITPADENAPDWFIALFLAVPYLMVGTLWWVFWVVFEKTGQSRQAAKN